MAWLLLGSPCLRWMQDAKGGHDGGGSSGHDGGGSSGNPSKPRKVIPIYEA